MQIFTYLLSHLFFESDPSTSNITKDFSLSFEAQIPISIFFLCYYFFDLYVDIFQK
jgi:hypothetical protein